MDYIIYRMRANEFMTFTDGQIVLMGDRFEGVDEYKKEIETGGCPMLIKIHYANQENIQYATFVDAITDETIGFFSYLNEDEFFVKLNEWAKNFIKSNTLAY